MSSSTVKKSTHSARDVKVRLYESLSALIKLKAQGKLYESSRKAIKLLKQSSAFGCYECAEGACKQLMQYYRIYDPSDFFYKKYETKKLEFSQKKKDEDTIFEYYNLIYGSFDRSRSRSPELMEQVEKYNVEVEDFEQSRDHGDFFYHSYYAFKCLYYQVIKDYDSLVNIAHKALTHFENSFLEFNISKILFAHQAAYGYLALGDYTSCVVYLDKCELYGLEDSSAYAGYLVIRARYEMAQGHDATPWINKIKGNYPDVRKMKDLLYVYNELCHGRAVQEWDHLKRYKNDPTGLGISLNIAKIWSALLSGDEWDHRARMEKFKARHLSDDPRSASIIDYIMYNRTPDSNNGAYNVDIEIIPYENIVDHAQKVKKLP